MSVNKVFRALMDALVNYENEKFYKLLFNALYNRLRNLLGSSRAITIFQQLTDKYINIVNIEGYLSDKNVLKEVGTDLFKRPLIFETYLEEVSLECKAFYDIKYKKVRLTAFLVHLAYLYKYYNRLTVEDVRKHLRWFVISISSKKENSPFIFDVLTESLFFRVRNVYGLRTKYEPYLELVVELKKVLDELKKELPSLKIPKIEVTVPVAFKARAKKEALIKKTFDVTLITSEKLNRLLDTTEYEEYRPYLKYMKRKSVNGDVDLNKLIDNLKAIDDFDQLLACKIHPVLSRSKIKKRYLFDYNIRNTREDVFLEVEIDCSVARNEEILSMLAQNAFALGIVKRKALGTSNLRNEGKIVVTFRNAIPRKDFVDEVLKEKDKMESLYMEEPMINIEFPSKSKNIDIEDESEYIRIISDIHCDVNRSRGYHFDFGDDFVINCGDTSGDCITTEDWIKKNMKRGVFVTGNHLGYNHPYGKKDENYEYKNTIEGQMEYLENAFKGTEVSYLNNRVCYFKGLTIIGTPLYTNFELFGTPNIEECMDYASKGLNDYVYCTSYITENFIEDERGKITTEPLSKPFITKTTPRIHRNMCYKNLLFLMRELEKHKDEPVIVVTHHAPTKYSIHMRYRLDRLNPCFANNLSKVLNRYPNIKMWANGHTHDSFEYTVNGRTLVVCEPFGYYMEQQDLKKLLPNKYGKRYKIEDILNEVRWKSYLADLEDHDLIDKEKNK